MAVSKVIRKKAIQSELRSLHEFGYSGISEKALFDGGVCTMFFESHLKDALEVPKIDRDIKDTLTQLLTEVQAALKKKSK